jgi:hypothetical protein
MSLPDYHCPGCGQLSGLAFSPTQAFCTNDVSCKVISWNPSIPPEEQKFEVVDIPWVN